MTIHLIELTYQEGILNSNCKTKLTTLLEIVKNLRDNPHLSYEQIARKCGSTKHVVRSIATKRTWKRFTAGIDFPFRRTTKKREAEAVNS